MICKSCFCADVTTQSNTMSDFTSNGRRIICCLCIVEKPKVVTPYSTKNVCSQCDDLTIVAYMSAIRSAERCESESRSKAERDALERKVEETRLEGELKLHENNEKERLRAMASLHRHRIVDSILTAKCPHCTRVFVDWSMCFAVKCESVDHTGKLIGCQNYFCGWCMNKYGDSSACHEHVRTCQQSLNPGSYYAKDQENPSGDFLKAQAPVRKQKIEKYLAESSLSPKERSAVIELMQRFDLAPLGVNI